jgi:hypothetical protein
MCENHTVATWTLRTFQHCLKTEGIQSSMKPEINIDLTPRVHIFSKILETTSKFKAPEGYIRQVPY